MFVKADIVFMGKVRDTGVDEVFYGTQEEAGAVRKSGMRLLGSAAKDLKPDVFYHRLHYQLIVKQPLKGNVRSGSMLKTKVALADKRELLDTFDPGWPKRPIPKGAKKPPLGPEDGLFMLRRDASGFTFEPLLLDFSGIDAAEAKRRRTIAVQAIAEVLKKDPLTIMSGRVAGGEVLKRLHVKAAETSPGRYRLTYDFSSPNQLKDWRAVNEDGKWLVKNGSLVQRTNMSREAPPAAAYLATCAEFAGDIEVVVRVKPVDDDIITTHIAFYCSSQNYVFLMDSSGGSAWHGGRMMGRWMRREDRFWHVWSEYDPGRTYTITMGRKGSHVYAKLDGNLLFDVKDDTLQSGSVAVGCKGQHGVRFDSVQITGTPTGTWTMLEPASPVAKRPSPRRGKKK
jgi:hypothetical protein